MGYNSKVNNNTTVARHVDCPCNQNCTAATGRTATCKFDGTCDKYIAWKQIDKVNKHMLEEFRKKGMCSAISKYSFN